jgi:hypothetical protein
MAWLCVCSNTPDDNPEESRAIFARAHKRTWARVGLKGYKVRTLQTLSEHRPSGRSAAMDDLGKDVGDQRVE